MLLHYSQLYHVLYKLSFYTIAHEMHHSDFDEGAPDDNKMKRDNEWRFYFDGEVPPWEARHFSAARAYIQLLSRHADALISFMSGAF